MKLIGIELKKRECAFCGKSSFHNIYLDDEGKELYECKRCNP